jgi:hypothetical protein
MAASCQGGQTVSVGDAYDQTQFILRKIQAAQHEVSDFPTLLTA